MTDDKTPAPDHTEKWTQSEAIDLCRKIEAICPEFGCHVVLTGGALYKDGPRKNLDVLFYRIRQVDRVDIDGLFQSLNNIGIEKKSGFGWCHKALYHGKKIDCFFPEGEGDDYPDDDDQIIEMEGRALA